MNQSKLIFNNFLLAEGLNKEKDSFLLKNFCGIVVESMDELAELAKNSPNKIAYLTGDRRNACAILLNCKFYIVKEYSSNYETLVGLCGATLIESGQVPINVYGVGVYFRKFFDGKNFFVNIKSEHNFQNLTESTKESFALRKGIYLSNVEQDEEDVLSFHLLRCSSNLQGPTDNFRQTDREIIDKTNEIVGSFFDQAANVNHVLAQIYYNVKDDYSTDRKATIKAHSDKTKDMPPNGLIAFATFYDMNSIADNSRLAKNDFDILFQGKSSVLTQLEFVLKDSVASPTLNPKFRVTLYPDSLFIISLETNRLYTHEIKPSSLPIEKIPVRLGYVMRSSLRKAVYQNGQTFIVEPDGSKRILEPMNSQDMADIKELYREENLTTATVHYRPIYTSLNQGDYQRPLK